MVNSLVLFEDIVGWQSINEGLFGQSQDQWMQAMDSWNALLVLQTQHHFRNRMANQKNNYKLWLMVENALCCVFSDLESTRMLQGSMHYPRFLELMMEVCGMPNINMVSFDSLKEICSLLLPFASRQKA
jgi:hypothetical protein